MSYFNSKTTTSSNSTENSSENSSDAWLTSESGPKPIGDTVTNDSRPGPRDHDETTLPNRSRESFALRIPHRNELAQQKQHQYADRRAKALESQKALVESAFSKMREGETTIEFDTEQPLLPEITQELTRNGYNYYYQYHCSSSNPESNGCHVVISTEPGRLPGDNLHHNETLYHLSRDLDRTVQRFNRFMSSFSPFERELSRSARQLPRIFW